MNSILCFALAICASMALTSAYPVAEPAEDISYIGLRETAPIQAAAYEETPQPEQLRYKRHHHHHGGWGNGGYGDGGYGYNGGWGDGWGGGYGDGYGGGYGGGYGNDGGWGGGW